MVRLGVNTPIITTSDSGPLSPLGDSAESAQVASNINRMEVKDAKASTIIMALCNQDVLQHILLLNTAKEQWEALKAQYAPLGH